MNKALFLDRDGVINVDHAYVHKVEDFEFIEGVFTACQAFVAAGYKIIVVTNQSGIGRGYYDEQQFHALSDWMCQQFSAHGIDISGVYFCPHHPEKAVAPYKVDCDCRKPEPGMLLQAIAEHNIDPTHSVMVGDKLSDIAAARAAAINTTVLVKSGQSVNAKEHDLADFVCDSIQQVPNCILTSAS